MALKSFLFRSLALLLLFNCFSFHTKAQTVPAPVTAATDTLRVIQIIQGDRLREKYIDSATTLQTIAGKVILKEGLTLFYCDSAVINHTTNILEAYGNIHINQNDSINTYSQSLRYIGNERIAYLKKDVRLTDGKGTLYTQDLEYSLATSIGKYKSGGKVVNGKTVLTSEEGVYYADTKDVYFKKNVHLVDPKYDMRNDTLLYNTGTQLSSWTTATFIKSKNGGDIYSENGTYDLKDGKAFFGNRSIVKDSTRTYTADNSAYDEKSGIAQLEGNAIIKDSVNGYTVLGGQIYLDKNKNTFLATKKPVLIFKGEGKDSTFLAGDTLFSGVEKKLFDGTKIITIDTLKQTKVISDLDSAVAIVHMNDSVMAIAPAPVDSAARVIVGVPDTLRKTVSPLPEESPLQIIAVQDSTNKEINKDSILYASLIKKLNPLKPVVAKPVFPKKNVDTTLRDTTIRYFIAFHNVRIFNDSLQSVCDSLYYTSEDSIFRLFKDPLVFSNNSQIAGDTIYLYTKNKKPERLYVWENGLIINKANEQLFNQIGGRTINGWFKNGEIDYVRAKGSPAESVYYPQDDDSAYIGMNRSKGDVIDVYFIDRAVNKVKFINDVDGTLYPLKQIPADQKYLPKYRWLDARRPKSKFELFE